MPETSRFVAPDFLALTIGIVVFFVGVLITQRVSFLRSYNIPEPVTGGFVAALAFWAVYAVFGLDDRLRNDDPRPAAGDLLRHRRDQRTSGRSRGWRTGAGRRSA